MKHKLLALITVAVAALALTGCRSTPRIVMMDGRVQESIACPGIQETRLPDGRMQIVAHLRNRENRRLQVQANCEFKDSQGFTLDATSFVNVIIDENAQEDVKFVSMNERAALYTIRVREAR